MTLALFFALLLTPDPPAAEIFFFSPVKDVTFIRYALLESCNPLLENKGLIREVSQQFKTLTSGHCSKVPTKHNRANWHYPDHHDLI